ncbi:S-layer homology domain-containing protein [Egicoccus sp. AB-alg6-2]|uniref:S-layer homology domain-containing protein n=1 Tax=Egicoccus sp. AB-alg6-2 TaxID=3242692 RepID=UPI00359D7D40
MRRGWITMALVGALTLSTGVVPVGAQPAASDAPCPPDTPRAPFLDVSPASTHAAGIDCAYALELVAGVTEDRFAPQRPVTRAQAATLVARALDTAGVTLPPAASGTDFADVPAAHRDNVRRLQAAGVVQGRADGTFGGSADVSREQFASLMVRALSYARGLDVRAAARGVFSDVTSEAHTANVEAAAEQGLLQGRTDGTFGPAASTRREQAASVAARLVSELRRGGDFQTAGGEVWVLDQGTDRIHVYDGDDGFEELVTIDVRPQTLRDLGFADAPTGAVTVPHMIEFDSQQRYAFVAATAGGVTLVIDARSKQVVAVLATGPGSHMAAVTPDDRAAWVAVIGTAGRHSTRANPTDPDADPIPAQQRKMVEIPLDLDAADPQFAIGRELQLQDLLAPLEAANGWEYPSYSPVCHQYDADSTEAWITLGPGWNQGGLVVLDLASGTLVEEAAFDPAVVKANCGVSVTEDRVIVNWSGRVEPGADTNGEWYVIDPETYELLATRDSEGSDAHGVRVTPDGSSYWQVNRNSDNALIIDAETLEVTGRLPAIADTPDILDFSPDGSLLYVTQRGPTPRSGAIHSASGQQPGVAIVEVATGRRLGVLTQAPVTNAEGRLVNDVHGIGVRVKSADDTVPQNATATTASFDARVVDPAQLGAHCSLPASV